MKKICVVVGARPNFVKIARLFAHAASIPELQCEIIHTGQHTHADMSEIFLRDFGLSVSLNLHSDAIDREGFIEDISGRISTIFLSHQPDFVLVVGDVNSTLAGARAAKKCGIPLAHLESGLRSFDESMPEEINRIETDKLSDICFVTEQSGVENLQKEGKKSDQIFLVGNTMIDALVHFSDRIEASSILETLNLSPHTYVLFTTHRQSNVDTKPGLERLLHILEIVGNISHVVVPLHPRTSQNLRTFGLWDYFSRIPNISTISPLGYFDMQKLLKNAHCVLTDSGGIQVESSFWNVPCITLRNTTEHKITTEKGSNVVFDGVPKELGKLLIDFPKQSSSKATDWSSSASEKVLSILCRKMGIPLTPNQSFSVNN